MIKVVAKLKVKSENLETFINLAKTLIEKSRAESGNISYTLNQHLAEPTTVAFIETWKDQEAIDIHNATEHYTTIFPKLMALSDPEILADFYAEIE